MTKRGNENAAYAADPRVKAFLDMIAHSEGTEDYGDNGYNVIVGYNYFSDYSQHPKRKIWVPSIRDYSTAAGRYQYIYNTWKGVQASNGLPDFSPKSQDIGAVELLRQRGSLAYILKGDIKQAIYKARLEWASFPGANYPGQGMRSLSSLLKWYNEALARYGGTPVSQNNSSANPGTKITEAGTGPVQVILIIGFALAMIYAYFNYR